MSPFGQKLTNILRAKSIELEKAAGAVGLSGPSLLAMEHPTGTMIEKIVEAMYTVERSRGKGGTFDSEAVRARLMKAAA